MFRLLSKESNIFSIPVYLFFLLTIVITFNAFNFSVLNIISAVFTFAGIALGYFLFNKVNLTYQTHIPLFLYTFLAFALYSGGLDIGVAISLFVSSFVLLILTSTNDTLRKSSYMLIGSILAVNFIFLPATWALVLFVIIHIIGTSGRILLNLFRLFFGMLLIALFYFSIVFFLHYNAWDEAYFPFGDFKMAQNIQPLLYLIPIGLLMMYGIAQHFFYFNEKSPISKFKYTFILLFTVAQSVSIVLYMGNYYGYLLLMVFPCAVIFSRAIYFMPKYWQKELSLWMVIIFLILFKIAVYIH